MLNLRVEGMSCGGCTKSVTKALQRLDAGANVRVDLPTGEVVVETSANESAVLEALARAGFPATATAR
jgi:copper chaperone